LISEVEPVGLSQQCKTQHDNLFKVIYVQGERLSSFAFQITSTKFELKEAFSSLIFFICPKSLAE